MPTELKDLRILVVEDEPMLAFVLTTILEDEGGKVVGPANSVTRGLRLLNECEFDCAIMDVRLKNETAFPLAEELQKRKIPFIFVTGNSSNTLREKFRDTPVLLKPFETEELISWINSVSSDMAATEQTP